MVGGVDGGGSVAELFGADDFTPGRRARVRNFVERAAIVEFARAYPLEGYRRLAFMMLDRDVAVKVLLSGASNKRMVQDFLREAQAAAKLRIEALTLIPRVHEFATTHGVKAPIFEALTRGILAARPVAEVIQALMASPVEGFV